MFFDFSKDYIYNFFDFMNFEQKLLESKKYIFLKNQKNIKI